MRAPSLLLSQQVPHFTTNFKNSDHMIFILFYLLYSWHYLLDFFFIHRKKCHYNKLSFEKLSVTTPPLMCTSWQRCIFSAGGWRMRNAQKNRVALRLASFSFSLTRVGGHYFKHFTPPVVLTLPYEFLKVYFPSNILQLPEPHFVCVCLSAFYFIYFLML